jgi:hypothetical protein
MLTVCLASGMSSAKDCTAVSFNPWEGDDGICTLYSVLPTEVSIPNNDSKLFEDIALLDTSCDKYGSEYKFMRSIRAKSIIDLPSRCFGSI